MSRIHGSVALMHNARKRQQADTGRLIAGRRPPSLSPDVGVVVILDMRALVAHRTALPHSTGPVHNEVIPNVAPASSPMRSAYRLDTRCGRPLISLEERLHPIVMNGDVPYGSHPVHSFW